MYIHFQNVSFTYDSAAQPLIKDLSVSFSRGWTGIVGPNGVGKTTILKLATKALEPKQGRVITPGRATYCRQRTDHAPDQLSDFIHATTSDTYKIKARLGIEKDWLDRWVTLSHGERKRTQIAVAIWLRPLVLAVDEPTNHLDVEAQALLIEALSTFNGIGIMVSHDRKLLDDLCHQCLFIDPPEAKLRPGNYSFGLHHAKMDEMVPRKQRTKAKNDLSRLKREAAKRRDAASQANRKRSKRGLAQKDHDGREKINMARVTGRDGAAGRKFSQLKGRLSQARMKMDSLKVKKTYEMGIRLPYAKSNRDTLFNLPGDSLSLGRDRRLFFPDLLMKPDDRIALTGLNGCGKSTLINHIIQSLCFQGDYVAYVPQEIDVCMSRDILMQVKNLPPDKLGQMMNIVSRLGSRPHRLLESMTPSPGEIRKLYLAIGVVNTPQLIVMDEPTNHLDLPSIECLEKALADYPCGLLLVSHDQRFLNALTHRQWHISENGRWKGRYVLKT